MDHETQQLEQDILVLISEGVAGAPSEERFGALALRLFAYQFERNATYAGFCRGRDATPETVRLWRDIPAVPTMAFKELPIACFSTESAAVVYLSSGTTGVKRSRHYLESLTLYDASLLANFKASVMPDFERMRILVLGPSPAMLPQSSLTHMLERVMAGLGAPGSDFYLRETGLDMDRLQPDLLEAEEHHVPVCLLGTAFAFVHFLDHCVEHGLRIALPAGSRIMDTGGYKGKSREVLKDELYDLYRTTLGVPLDHVVNEYGMTEMCSQFYDDCLARPRRAGPRHKLAPPWARTVVVDPETLEPVPEGRTGLLRHYDLANLGSVMAVQTDDLGVQIGDGFEILGRASGAEARGCSIAIDELLSRSG